MAEINAEQPYWEPVDHEEEIPDDTGETWGDELPPLNQFPEYLHSLKGYRANSSEQGGQDE